MRLPFRPPGNFYLWIDGDDKSSPFEIDFTCIIEESSATMCEAELMRRNAMVVLERMNLHDAQRPVHKHDLDELIQISRNVDDDEAPGSIV